MAEITYVFDVNTVLRYFGSQEAVKVPAYTKWKAKDEVVVFKPDGLGPALLRRAQTEHTIVYFADGRLLYESAEFAPDCYFVYLASKPQTVYLFEGELTPTPPKTPWFAHLVTTNHELPNLKIVTCKQVTKSAKEIHDLLEKANKEDLAAIQVIVDKMRRREEEVRELV